MIILGIDPGTRRIGYGLIEKMGSSLCLRAAGLLTIKSRDNLGALLETKQQMDALLKTYQPSILAVEKLFFVKNQKTGIQVAQARGVVMVCGLEHNVRIYEYAPNEIKAGVAGYGFADKRAMAKMVRLVLRQPDLKVIDDATDALATAIFASQRH